jgi:hypothetical protein
MAILQVYLTLTVILYAFGPWPWPTNRPELLFSFLLLVQISLIFGYWIGLKSLPRAYCGSWSVKTIITISIFANLIWIIPNFSMRSGGTVDLASLATSIIKGLIDPGQSYRDKIAATSGLNETSALQYITQLINPLLWMMSPLCIYFWSRISKLTKISFIIAVSANLLSWLAIGTNKGIFDFVLMSPAIILAARPHLIARMNGKTLSKGLLAASIVGVLLFSQFSNNIKGRSGGEASTIDYGANISLDHENWMIASLPKDSQASAGTLISYLSQGYYPLSLALDEPFVFSYGVGNSYYYTGIVESFTGPNSISELTYPARIAYTGWSRTEKWHSIYPWIASDISFAGVPFFVLIIGWLLAAVWRDSLAGQNPFAISLLPLLILIVFYFPANNQILAFSETSNSFYAIMILWLFTRKEVRA